ncbi:uncharacterized protein LOC103506713 [Diaphorina citri]|uniref:Uncharacterized protein LOC103506713 n=1 Tax=Diaphorina citri TaxID=121845 RepID=A0A3Q0IMF8_DIACI|nr:uncharacterized protein LOC103506713 [Diaphorina citri]
MAERWREFDRLSKLKDLVSDIMNKTLDDLNCMVVLSDGFYQPLFTKELYSRFHEVPYFKIRVGDNEDLLAPNYKTLAVLKEARKSGCNTYIIVMANGDQLGRLLKFGDRHRVLDTRARYVFLFDFRLIQPGLHYIWKKIVNVIFLREYARSGRYEIITTPFPVPIQEVLVPRRLDYWHHRKFQPGLHYIWKKIVNVIFLREYARSGRYEIITTPFPVPIQEVFRLIQPGLHYIWKKIVNVIFLREYARSGRFEIITTPFPVPIQEVLVPRRLDYWHHRKFQVNADLFRDKTSNLMGQTLQVVTIQHVPASIRTIISPTDSTSSIAVKYSGLELEKLSNSINEMLKEKPSTEGLYLFKDIDNSFLYTLSMLLVVSLPKMPTGWALRMLTGWWWLYCVLVVVAYRASLTAILANPAPRGGGGGDVFDDVIGYRSDHARASGFARRDTLINSTMQTSMSSLHIMSSCIINMPISLGLQKNSPLKPRVDTFMQRVIEAGLVKKWLNDVMLDITVTETEALSGNEEVKALMDLKKLYGGIVVLIVGSGLSILILLGELIHWYLVTKRSPHYDQYNVVKYYKTLRHY